MILLHYENLYYSILEWSKVMPLVAIKTNGIFSSQSTM